MSENATPDDIDLESTLKKEELELIRDKEIQRILECFKLDFYTILDIQPGIAAKDITRIFRKKSLLIHPDKSSNPRAPDAFDLLKTASKILTEEPPSKEREQLDEIWTDSRRLLIKQNNLSLDDDHLKSPEFLQAWRLKVKELLIEEEFIKRMEIKKQQQQESKKRVNDENELQKFKEQKKINEVWEGERSNRVNHWRDFSQKLDNKRKKKKKDGSKVLI